MTCTTPPCTTINREHESRDEQPEPTSIPKDKPEDTPRYPWEPPTHTGKTRLPERHTGILRSTSSTPKSRAQSKRDRPIVRIPKEHPPNIPNIATSWEIPRPSWPTRIVIQKHSFWAATSKSCSVQQWVFDIASKRNHKVCIVLLWRKYRLYTSFTNAEAFWNITPVSKTGDASTG